MPRPRKAGSEALPKHVKERYGSWYFTDHHGKMHKICRVAEGEAVMLERLKVLSGHEPSPVDQTPSMLKMIDEYIAVELRELDVRARRESESQYFKIATAFAEYNYDEVLPRDIKKFLRENFEEGSRIRQVYRSRLSKFFAWLCTDYDLRYNPVAPLRNTEIRPKKRKRYITNEEYYAIREALVHGDSEQHTPAGAMVQCFVDLCYLTLQRSTEIRNLKWSQIGEDSITFLPSKTADSSGLQVKVKLTPAIREVLERARMIGAVKSMYVIHMRDGQPYTASGVREVWRGACRRAGVIDATIKDLRGKAVTDARKSGYTLEEIQVAVAHTDIRTTQDYVKQREQPESAVIVGMPKK